MMRLLFVVFALAVATSAQAMSPAKYPSARQHAHSSPRSMRCRFSHGQWDLRAYRRPPQRRQMCSWNAHGWWPLRQMKRPKTKCCKQGSLRF